MVQHLPPPAGIAGQPPVTGQPPVSPDGTATALAAAAGERPASSDRAHPNRTHPRPDRSGSLGRDAPTRPDGTGGGGSGPSRPPVTASPVAAVPAVEVRVPPVGVRVRPPSLLGRDLGDVRAETPAASVTTPSVQIPRLG